MRLPFCELILSVLISVTTEILPFVTLIQMEQQRKFLVYGGKTGWIGQQLIKLLQEKGEKVIAAESRMENREDVVK